MGCSADFAARVPLSGVYAPGGRRGSLWGHVGGFACQAQCQWTVRLSMVDVVVEGPALESGVSRASLDDGAHRASVITTIDELGTEGER